MDRHHELLLTSTVSLAPPAASCRHRASSHPVSKSLWRIDPHLKTCTLHRGCSLHRLHTPIIPVLAFWPTGFSSKSVSLSARYSNFAIVQRCGPRAASPPPPRASIARPPSMLKRTTAATEYLHILTATGAQLRDHTCGRGSAVRRRLSALGSHAR